MLNQVIQTALLSLSGVNVKICTHWRLALILSVSLAAFAETPAVHAENPTFLPLMPLPLHVAEGEGRLKIDGGFSIGLEGYKDARLESARKRFLSTLSRETGIPYHDETTGGAATLTVKTAGASDAVQKLGEEESYRLEISPTHALLTAQNPLGAMHGLQTFLQMVRSRRRDSAFPRSPSMTSHAFHGAG